jgi:chromate reductase
MPAVFALCGSLRRASYNAAVLRAAVEIAPEGMSITTFDRLGEIPPYDEDLRQQGLPPAVEALRQGVAAADGVLIVTPEYNYSVPGVLKNAIDWASRPPAQPFDHKAVAVGGASPGRNGTARCQYHLRQSFVFLNSLVMTRPELIIAAVDKMVTPDGRLTDRPTIEHLRSFMGAFADWIAFVQRGSAR